jgi:hypothetical protein
MTTPRFPRLHHRFSVQQTEHSRSTSRNMAAGNLAALCVSIDDSNPIPLSATARPPLLPALVSHHRVGSSQDGADAPLEAGDVTQCSSRSLHLVVHGAPLGAPNQVSVRHRAPSSTTAARAPPAAYLMELVRPRQIYVMLQILTMTPVRVS